VERSLITATLRSGICVHPGNLKKGRGNMKKVTVSLSKLLETVKKNRDAHSKEYEVAWQEYVQASIVAIDELREEFTKDPTIPLHIAVPVPECHVDDYDEAIIMLEASCDEKIELDYNESRNLLMNKWNWVGELGHTRAVYANFLKKM
jgi:hypothetical protein